VITVKRIQLGEIELYKQIRLASLKDAPYAFESTYESAVQRNDETWGERAQSGAQGNDGATFLAFSDDRPIGMAALFRSQGQMDLGELMQVWVSPDYRGSRAAWDLMDGIFHWAKDHNFRRIIAGVTNVNPRAIAFYNRYGFSRMAEPAGDDSGSIYLIKEVSDE
jgi:GNAT superfamily N-acetyltransferase